MLFGYSKMYSKGNDIHVYNASAFDGHDMRPLTLFKIYLKYDKISNTSKSTNRIEAEILFLILKRHKEIYEIDLRRVKSIKTDCQDIVVCMLDTIKDCNCVK